MPMTAAAYQRFDTPGIAAGERLPPVSAGAGPLPWGSWPCSEFWRGWDSRDGVAPTRLDPVGRLAEFRASAEVLGVGEVAMVDLRFGPVVGSWAREATEPLDRLGLVLVAPTPGATGFLHGREMSLVRGAVSLMGRTDGLWRAPSGLRVIHVNVPRPAVPVTDRDIDRINDPARLLRDPTFTWLVRPFMLGVAGHLDTLARADVSEFGGLWISLMNMLVRSLAGDGTNGVDTAQARRLQMRRHIQANLADPRLSPASVADALHVSRGTLYGALAPDDDGVAGEIRRQRLDRARSMLLDPSRTRSVAEIAGSVGLPNAAHFSRLFRARYGVNPSEVRSSPAATDGGRGNGASSPLDDRGHPDHSSNERLSVNGSRG
jgi:AraC-like DNA-binding protein